MAPSRGYLDRRVFLVIVGVSLAATTVAGGAVFGSEKQELLENAHTQMEAISHLREGNISGWRSEHLTSTIALAGSLQLSDEVVEYLRSTPDRRAPAHLQAWTDSLITSGDADRAYVIDAAGRIRLQAPLDALAADARIQRSAGELLRTGGAGWIDFYTIDAEPQLHLATIAAIGSPRHPAVPIGVVVLQVDPTDAFSVLLDGWPTTSRTAETLLVRREGADVVFLHPRPFEPAAPGNRRHPLTDSRLLAAQAALGVTGRVEGIDHLGHRVAGHILPVRGTTWRLVTHMDFEEIEADVWSRMGVFVAFALAFLLSEAAVFGWLWRDRRVRHDYDNLKLFTALKESEERLRLAMSSANQGMFDLDIATGEAIVSREYATMLGYDPAQFRETYATWLERLHPGDRDRVAAIFSDYIDGRTHDYKVEFRIGTRDGSWKWVLSHGRAVSWSAGGRPLRLLGTYTDINARKLAELKLQASLGEKDALLKEVHHRVKNNLQVVTSLLRLESGRSDQPAVKQVLSEMQGRVLSMALLHETLYQSENLAAIDLSVYLTKMANQVFRSLAEPSGGVTLRLTVTPRMVDLDQAVACGLLANELISNSLKHGFPEGRRGEVVVELDDHGADHSLRLRVSDTGVGLPPDFTERRGRSLGLQLVSDLVVQLHGTLDIGAGPGACFTVVFVPKASLAPKA